MPINWSDRELLPSLHFFDDQIIKQQEEQREKMKKMTWKFDRISKKGDR